MKKVRLRVQGTVLGLVFLSTVAQAQLSDPVYVWYLGGNTMELTWQSPRLRIYSGRTIASPVATNLTGALTRVGGLTFLEGRGQRWLILESVDGKLLALYRPRSGNEWPPFYLARRHEGEAWEDRFSGSVSAQHGIFTGESLFESVSTQPPTPEARLRALQVPHQSWLSPPQAVGTQITFRFFNPSRVLYVSNGFVEYDQPELWSQYARVRELEIRMEGWSQIVTLADTPQFQKITLQQEVPGNQPLVWIIRSVYPGSRAEAGLNMVVPIGPGLE